MKIFIYLVLISSSLLAQTKTSSSSTLKPRLVVLTDISTWETDDHESLIRLMVHADMYEIEGIIITTGWSMDDVNKVKQFKDIATGVIDAYQKDLPNLLKRSNQNDFVQDEEKQKIGYWPSADYLRERTMFGSMLMGMDKIGVDNNSDGSNLIIQLADEEDNRPIWVTFWGGGNTLAQSIWQVQQTRSKSELKAFLHKLRVYAITDQDRPQKSSFEISSHAWMRRNFSNDFLFIWDDCAWKYQNGTGKNNWTDYENNIQNHGNLGNQYPKYKYGVEGDTPAFLHIMPNGLNNPDEPTQASWGGYSKWGKGEDNNGYSFINYNGNEYDVCNKYEKYFYPATFNNFSARMDWAKDGKGNINPIIEIDGDPSLKIITKKAKQGATMIIDASASFDPDGDTLNYKWWIQPEAGTYTGTVNILNNDSNKITINIPSNSGGKNFHVICEVTDNGSPQLTSYRRIIVELTK
ncbi:nucleoside hydrolase-like domain-containing protein [Lutimonas sp.]|uniref:nucleoside hydrolase-like domain-containing protein n=1 Tax=Lutimonas sp. TaxID=1872403 RepID=UPI003C769843